MDELRAKLNGETARMPWRELARFFAAGRVIRVSAELDLVEVAAALAEDDAARVGGWITAGRVAPASDVEAAAWDEADALLWAVVVKPYVLVQAPLDDA